MDVYAEGFIRPERQWVSTDQGDLLVRVSRGGAGGRIEGTLVSAEDGQPLPCVSLEARNNTQTGGGIGTTDAGGRFVIGGLEATRYTIATYRGNKDACQKDTPPSKVILTEPVTVDVPADRPVTGLQLEATEGAMLSGRILSAANGQPMPRACVQFYDEQGKWIFLGARADENGTYSAGPLPTGRYQVKLYSGSNVASNETITHFAVPALSPMNGVDFTIKPDPCIRGLVVDASGAPAPAISVVAVPTGRWVAFSALTGGDGRFELAMAKDMGALYVQAVGDGYASTRMGPLRAGDEAQFQLEATGRIEGELVDTSGHPIKGGVVYAVPASAERLSLIAPDGTDWQPDGDAGTRTRTSLTGWFDFDPLLPGNYDLDVYLPTSTRGYPAATAKAAVQAGQLLRTRLVVDSGNNGTIEGTVTMDGAPVQGIIVEAYAKDDKWTSSLLDTTGADGRYVLANVRPGEVSLTAYLMFPGTANRVSQYRTIHIAEGETQIVDFNLEQARCAVEGHVLRNGQPVRASLYIHPEDKSDAGTSIDDIRTDASGYYRAETVQEGLYAISASDIYSQDMGRRQNASQTVQLKAGETARCDINMEGGTVEGTITGLRENERAAAALFPGGVDLAVTAIMSPEEIEKEMLFAIEIPPGERLKLIDVPAGVYYLGAVAAPVDTPVTPEFVLDCVRKGRYSLIQVEVEADRITAVDIALP